MNWKRKTKKLITDLEEADKLLEEITSSIPQPTSEEQLGKNEYWIIPGQWQLKIDNVEITEYRNQFTDIAPAEVVIINYTYENLGYESDFQDLYLTPDLLIDETGEVGYLYPASTTTSPQPIPNGTKCVGAQAAFGYNNNSSSVTILFEKYDNFGTLQKMKFIVPVTGK